MKKTDVSKNVALFLDLKSPAYLDRLIAVVEGCAKNVTTLAYDTPLCEVFDAKRYDIVIIVGMTKAPSGAKQAVRNYLSEGGRVMTLGGPTFFREQHLWQGRWDENDALLKDELSKFDFEQAAKCLLLDTQNTQDVAALRNDPFNADHGTSYSLGDFGLEGSTQQMRVQIGNLKMWNSYKKGVTVDLEGADAVALYARADDDRTCELGVQVTDAEGACWFKVLSLTRQWQLFVITAPEFKLYKDSRSERTMPDLSSIRGINVGYTYDWMRIQGGSCSYCLGSMYLCHAGLPCFINEPRLVVDGLMPMTELYPITNGASMATHPNQVIVKERNYALPKDAFSCYPRRQGTGYESRHAHRFIPLIEIRDEKGFRSGYAAWLTVFSRNLDAKHPLNGGMLACFTANSEEFYDENGMAAIGEVLSAMMRNHFLLDGGTKEHTYMIPDDEQTRFGATAVALRDADAVEVITTVSLYDQDQLLAKVSSGDAECHERENGVYYFEGMFDFKNGRPTRAVTEMTYDGCVIDRIEQEVHFWQPKPMDERRYVYVEDGYFKRDGKIVTLFGANYAPTCRAGISGNGGGHWLSAPDYDPEVVEMDLKRLKEVGFNALALWAYIDPMDDGNTVLDLLRRCENHGFYVDMAMNTNFAYPLRNFQPEWVKRFIKRQHLDEMDFVVAYDIEWEPRIGTYEGRWNHFQGPECNDSFIGRKRWDGDWAKWIDVQYGSLDHAQELWGVVLEKTPEGYPYVSDAILDDVSGTYTKMVSAYYRFLDDQVAGGMIKNLNYMRTLAPHQMFSLRMSMAGSGQRVELFRPSIHCFDFQSMAPVLDFLCPEGYVVGKAGRSALQLPVANAYARYTAPKKPVVWKEYGYDSWSKKDDSNFIQSEQKQRECGECTEVFLEYMYRAYTSAMYYWWSTTGYRADEDGDCGLLNPDGSDRLISKAIRKYAPLFKNQGERPENNELIEVERDNQPGAIYGVFEAVIDRVEKVWSEGKNFDFVDATQKDFAVMSYADEVCAAAVGGTQEKGLYPLRYVNGMVKDVAMQDDGTMLVTVCNTKQSFWRAGTVSLVSTAESEVAVKATVDQDVDYLQDVVVKVPVQSRGKLALRFEVCGRLFGDQYEMQVE